MFRGQRVLHQFGVGTDHHQQVVKIVGHAAGKLADCIHFLGLLQLRFQPAPFGNVAVIRDEMCNLALAVSYGSDGFLCVENLPALLAIRQYSTKHIS